MHRRLSQRQIAALAVLGLGVACVDGVTGQRSQHLHRCNEAHMGSRKRKRYGTSPTRELDMRMPRG